MPIFIKRGFNFWREDVAPHLAQLATRAERLKEVIRLYEAGYAGAIYDPESRAELMEMQRRETGYTVGSDLATATGIADLGKGKLSIPFLAQAVKFKGCFPGAGQEQGDCVVHGLGGAAAITIANEIWTGSPDEVSGKIEGVPDGPDVWREGVISPNFGWWTRRRGGNGWDCASAVRGIMREGMILMRNYPELGIDFSDYSQGLNSRYARSGPPANVAAVAREHTIRESIEADTQEATRDLMAAGKGIIDCGSQGYSSTRDQNGVSKRRGSWAHSMRQGGFDDRPWAYETYGEPLVLIGNSWGTWNSGGRDIQDSARYVPAALKQFWIQMGIVNPATGNIMIPDGWFWTPWSHAANRYRIALSGANGWVAQDNPWLAL